MKTIKLIMAFFLAMLFWTIPCMAAPKAVLVNPVYHFASLPEGEAITHEFVVKNEGNAPLNILKVMPP